MKNDDLQEYIDQRRADPHCCILNKVKLAALRRAIKTLVSASWRNL